MTTKTTAAAKPTKTASAKQPTRVAQLYAMLSHAGGASIDEIAGAFGWATHSCRGLISTSRRKLGWSVKTERQPDRRMVYQITPPQAVKPSASGQRAAAKTTAQAKSKEKAARPSASHQPSSNEQPGSDARLIWLHERYGLHLLLSGRARQLRACSLQEENTQPRRSPMTKAARNHEQALAAFVSTKANIDQMLGELQGMSDEHFFTSPDDVNWADVGNVTRIERRLCELMDMLKMEGEYADQNEPRAEAVRPSRRRAGEAR
jgi:hypothetical protein